MGNLIWKSSQRGVLGILAALCSLPACSSTDSSTGVIVEISFGDLALKTLELTARREAPPATLGPRKLADGSKLESGLKRQVLLPDAWDGRRTRFDVRGLDDAGKVLASGGAWGTPSSDDPPVVKVTLAASCPADCTPGEARCVSDQVQRCVEKTPGCLTWAAPEDCPSDEPSCSNGLCAAQCKDECEGGQRRCASEGTAQVCGEHDSDDCLDWGSLLACGPTELCLDGQCVLACDGKACPCEPGDTEPCADQGECKGGVRRCTGGQYGECEWQAGKQPEICDGKDNDCNGTEDDADQLVAPACAKQQGVCKGAVKACGGAKGWLACGDADYAAHSPLYQADESTCGDGDNDCDGTEDEPASCCQPDCADKACGADSGCGSPCQSGSCGGANETCQGGKCVCQPSCAGQACGADDGCGKPCQSGTCGGANETCQAGKCACQPSCGARVCGPEPACGTSCGTCTGGTQCDASGQCAAQPSCAPVAPETVDASGDMGYGNSVGADSAGKLHVAYFDDTNKDLRYATNKSGSWVHQTIASSGSTGRWPSLVVDDADKVHVIFIDSSASDLLYVTNKSGAWVTLPVDTDGIGGPTALAIDSSGALHASFYLHKSDYDYTDWDLRYATNKSGSWALSEYVDTEGNVGLYNDIAVDPAGKAHVCYFDETNIDLKYATDRSGSWVVTALDTSGDAGSYCSIAADSAGKIHISYADETNEDLRYATDASGTWQLVTLDKVGSVGWHTSMAVDAAGKIHISYTDDTKSDLKYATNASGSWVYATLDSTGDVGRHNSLALGALGSVHVTYYDTANTALKHAAVCPATAP